MPRGWWGALVLFAACAGGTEHRATDVPLRVATATLTIGTLDGPDPYVFGRITGLAMDQRGWIYVADDQADEIRAFGPDGRFRYLVARRGAGPGEVRGPCCMAVAPDSTLWVREFRGGRYQVFRLGDSAAVSEATFRLMSAVNGYVADLTHWSGGFVDAEPLMGEGEGLIRFFRGRDGDVLRVDTIRQPAAESLGVSHVRRDGPGGTVTTFYVYEPYGSMPLVALGPGGRWASAASGYYAVRASLTGHADTLVGREFAPPPLSMAERDQGRALLARDERLTGRPSPFSVPDRKAPLRDLMFDSRGRLWVELSQADGDARLADVYADDGTRVEQVTWPASVRLAQGWIGDTVALGVTADSLGVQRLVRLEWRRR